MRVPALRLTRVFMGIVAVGMLHMLTLLLSLWVIGSELAGIQVWQWVLVLGIQGTAAWISFHLFLRSLQWKKRQSRRISPEVKAERERIAQDLHDGVGAHLSQALALLQSPQVALTEVRHSIENAMWRLRVEVEALDDADASLLELLAAMRGRLQPLLPARGITMRWQMPNEPEDCSPRGRKGAELAMVAQEAISNALQHAQCTQLQVFLGQDPDGCRVLRIADNGKGWEMAKASSEAQPQPRFQGRGLKNMRTRAQRVGAQLEISSLPDQGVCICVSWP